MLPTASLRVRNDRYNDVKSSILIFNLAPVPSRLFPSHSPIHKTLNDNIHEIYQSLSGGF